MEKKACCIVSISPVRYEGKDQSEMVTQLLFGELVSILEINEPWVKIVTETDAYEGYVDIKHLELLTPKEAKRWSDGLTYVSNREIQIKTNYEVQYVCRGSFLPENAMSFTIGDKIFSILSEANQPFSSSVELAKDYINTPYLWGGKSPYGIDCSGLTQTVYRIFNYNLPRDASEQFLHGSEVAFNQIEAGDLAFFENKNGKIIHVGILDGKGGIIHASGHVRIDKITEEGIIHINSNVLTHKLTKIKRL